MKEVIGYITEYFRQANKLVLLLCSIMIAILIWLNYHYGLEHELITGSLPGTPFTGHYIISFTAFIIPYILYTVIDKKTFFNSKPFVILAVVAPAVFALKMSVRPELFFSNNEDWNDYWNQVYYWPGLFVITLSILFLLWWKFDKKNQPLYGVTAKNFKWKPYVVMLLIMLPLIAAASTQHDFLQMYPKIKTVLHIEDRIHLSWWHKLLFELSYGSDFLSIELFFRGFLILAFIKWAGRDAILPMACFYCTIHFGKPLGECISSYFGGMILGIVVYNTQTIYGGLIVHLGIAWLMEIGGYLGG
jgi:hypothetical protein